MSTTSKMFNYLHYNITFCVAICIVLFQSYFFILFPTFVLLLNYISYFFPSISYFFSIFSVLLFHMGLLDSLVVSTPSKYPGVGCIIS